MEMQKRLRIGKLYQQYLYLEIFEYSDLTAIQLFLWSLSQSSRRYLFKYNKLLIRQLKSVKEEMLVLNHKSQVLSFLLRSCSENITLKIKSNGVKRFNDFFELIKNNHKIKLKQVKIIIGNKIRHESDFYVNSDQFMINIGQCKGLQLKLTNCTSYQCGFLDYPTLDRVKNYSFELQKKIPDMGFLRNFRNLKSLTLTKLDLSSYHILKELPSCLKKLKIMNKKKYIFEDEFFQAMSQLQLDQLTFARLIFSKQFLALALEFKIFPKILKVLDLLIKQKKTDFKLLNSYLDKTKLITNGKNINARLEIFQFKDFNEVEGFIHRVDKIHVCQRKHSKLIDEDFNTFISQLRPNYESQLKHLELIHSNFNGSSIEYFYAFLIMCPNLESLTFNDFTFGFDSIQDPIDFELKHLKKVIIRESLRTMPNVFLQKLFQIIMNNVQILELHTHEMQTSHHLFYQIIYMPLPKLKQVFLKKFNTYLMANSFDSLLDRTLYVFHINSRDQLWEMFMERPIENIQTIILDKVKIKDYEKSQYLKDFKGKVTIKIANTIWVSDYLRLKQELQQHDIRANFIVDNYDDQLGQCDLSMYSEELRQYLQSQIWALKPITE